MVDYANLEVRNVGRAEECFGEVAACLKQVGNTFELVAAISDMNLKVTDPVNRILKSFGKVADDIRAAQAKIENSTSEAMENVKHLANELDQMSL